MIDLTNPIFTDEAKAREHFESIRWPDGPYCPYCGQFETVKKLGGKSMGDGWYHCKDCRRKFTALVGTVYHRSHIPLHKWLLATHLMCASKKGVSAHQLHRMLNIHYRSAWFMAMRIREAMTPSDTGSGPMGGEGKIVEADTTYIGGKEKNKHRGKRDPKAIGGVGKQIVHTLVERGGKARSHHVPSVSGATLRPILDAVDRKSSLMTDTAGGYLHVGREFTRHEMVDHGKGEYVRGDAHSNTAEGFFSILKRGIVGVFHHVSEKHLARYITEFDFRFSERAALGIDDTMRAEKALRGTIGKRLIYRENYCAQA
jgi:transposase-like protein